MNPMGYNRSATNLAAGLCPNWAITIDVLRAVSPMVIPPASPEMARPDRGAIQLMARVARNLLVDLVRCWPVQVGLDLRSAVAGLRFGARIFR